MDHSAAPLHSFVARPFFYSVVAFLVFCLYSPLRCPEHLRQYRRLSIVKSYSPPTAPFLLCLLLRLTSSSLALLFRACPLTITLSPLCNDNESAVCSDGIEGDKDEELEYIPN